TRRRASPSMAAAWEAGFTGMEPAAGGVACAGSDVEIGGAKRAIGLLEDGLDLELRLGEPLAGGAEPRNALFEERQGVIELGVIRLELAADFLEPGKLGGKCIRRGRRGRGGLATHDSDSTRARTFPSATRRVKGRPGVNCAARLSTLPSGPVGSA